MKNFIINIIYKIISLIDYIDYHYIKKEKLIDNYKTTEEIILNDIEILSDTGYKPLYSITITKPFDIYSIELENGYKLDCADEHRFFGETFNEIYAKDLHIGDYIQTDQGLKKVISIKYSPTKISMCDTCVNDENHRFYSNGILSHNSVTTAIYCLWVILFNTDKIGLILSKSGPAGVDLLKKIKDMYLYLPYHLKCGTLKWNQSEISFDNNSSISTEPFSPTAGLGKTINFLILDEFAWCPPNDVELFYNNIIPTVTTMSDANVCIMSTQNGFNLFYKLWRDSVEKKNIYGHYKIDWNQVPQWNKQKQIWEKRTEKWKEEQVGILGSEEAFQYQYGTMFSASDKCLVSRECLTELRDKAILWENRIEDISIALPTFFMAYAKYMFWRPEFNFADLFTKFFLITIDLAEGSGQDHTVFNIFMIIDKDKFYHVGRWDSNAVDLEHAALEFWLLAAQLFNSERCIWSLEWNTYGALFYTILQNLNENDYDETSLWRFNFAPEGLELFNFIMYKKGSFDDQILNKNTDSKTIPGIRLNSSNKATACSLLKLLFEKKNIDTNDLITISQIETFEDKNGNGSYKASSGHDDVIMTYVQIPLVQQQPRYKDLLEDLEASKMYNNINSKFIPNSPFSIYTDNNTLNKINEIENRLKGIMGG